MRDGIVGPAYHEMIGNSTVAIQPDPYFALPSLYGAPAYSRPPRPPVAIERPADPDDLPLATQQTEEERRIAEALLSARELVGVGAGVAAARDLPGGRDAGYLAAGSGPRDPAPELLPRRLSLRVLTGRIRPRG